jgi:hypothetical protein
VAFVWPISLICTAHYAHYTTIFIINRLVKGCFGRFGTDYGYFHYFLWEKYSWLTTNLSYDQPSRTNWVRKSMVHCRWKGNIKVDIQEVGWGMDWTDLAQVRGRFRAAVNAVAKFPVPQNTVSVCKRKNRIKFEINTQCEGAGDSVWECKAVSCFCEHDNEFCGKNKRSKFKVL